MRSADYLLRVIRNNPNSLLTLKAKMRTEAMAHARILVVDDELTIRNTVRAYLEQEGFSVQTAAACWMQANRFSLSTHA